MDRAPTAPESSLAAAIAKLKSAGFEAELMDWLSRCVAHDNITILAYFQDRRPTMLASQNRQPKVHENFERIYLAGAYLLDPFHDLHISRAPRGVYRLSEIAPDQFQRNRYFIDYYQNTTLVDEIAFISYPADGVSIHTCLGRDSNSNRRFSPKMITAAERIEPIVSSLVEAHWSDLNTSGKYTEAATTSNLITAARDRHSIHLSPRQAEVAMLILRGHSSVSIGLRLGISSQTVKVFRKQLYKKCKISSQAELFNLLLPLLGN